MVFDGALGQGVDRVEAAAGGGQLLDGEAAAVAAELLALRDAAVDEGLVLLGERVGAVGQRAAARTLAGRQRLAEVGGVAEGLHRAIAGRGVCARRQPLGAHQRRISAAARGPNLGLGDGAGAVGERGGLVPAAIAAGGREEPGGQPVAIGADGRKAGGVAEGDEAVARAQAGAEGKVACAAARARLVEVLGKGSTGSCAQAAARRARERSVSRVRMVGVRVGDSAEYRAERRRGQRLGTAGGEGCSRRLPHVSGSGCAALLRGA